MHDSTIAIVGPDGALLFACALERLSRTKQDGRWPAVLLDAVPWDRIDRVAVAGLEIEDADRLGETLSDDGWPAPAREGERKTKTFAYPGVWRERLESLPRPRVYYDHHLCHAASAYYLTGHEKALVVTCDAGAHQCPWNAASYRAEGDRIELRGGMHFQRFLTPAHLYTLVTGLIGLRPNRHEGKVTGLAARGVVAAGDIARFEEIAWPMANRLGVLARWDMAVDTDYAPTIVVNEARRQAWRREFAWLDDAQLAACVQHVAEREAVAMVRHARKIAGNDLADVCLAGGFFANVRVNQAIAEDGFDGVFIAPPMTDDGLAMGAALLARVQSGGSRPNGRVTMFLGPRITAEDARGILEENGVAVTPAVSLAGKVAELLAEGRVVAVARGCMEFGPRALGHRSVLSGATDPTVNDWLNEKLQRTEYMPFAPVLLERNAASCLTGRLNAMEDATRFMTITTGCAPDFAAAAPAVVHVDGTARPQVLRAGDEPFCEEVLARYERLTGLRAIINTSFNVHEEPITCSAHDALIAFAQTGLDALVLGDSLVLRAGNEQVLEDLIATPERGRAGAGNLPLEMAHSRWVDAVIHDADELRSWIEQLEKAREWHETALEEARVENRGLVEKLAEMQARIADLERALTELRERSDRFEHELGVLHSSKWVRFGRRLRIIGSEGGYQEGAC